MLGRGELEVVARGLIDRDGRTDAEVQNLESIGVAVLDWAEVENLLVCEGAVRDVALALHLEAQPVLDKVKERVLKLLATDIDRVAAELAGRDLDRKVREWPWKHQNGAHD